MLSLNKISHVAVHQEDWRKERRGKITASQFSRLVGENSHNGKFTKGAITYFEELAYEIITGEDYKEEIFTKDIDYGNAMEIESVQYFLAETGLFVINAQDRWDTHKLIIHDEVFGATPDALITLSQDENKIFSEDGNSINVRTLELKNNRKKFPKFYKCKTPEDLLKAEPAYYYQVVAQMEFCGAAVGYWATYHPAFPNKMRIIEFKKSAMLAEFQKFNAACYYAKKELLNTVEQLKAA